MVPARSTVPHASVGTKFAAPRSAAGLIRGMPSMTIGRGYFVRQAQTILKYAKWTKDPVLHSALIQKATELASKVDDKSPPPDLSPRPPDVEREA